MQRKTQRLLLILAIFAASFGAVALMLSAKPEPEKKDNKVIDLLVDVMRLENSTAAFEIRSQGTVQPLTETILSAEVSGPIVSISPKFVAGGVFEKNEQLLRIDPGNYRVAVDQAEAILLQRQIEYDGAQKLRSQGYRAESEFASAAAALATAKAELVRAKRNLENTVIRLPYEGMVRSKETDLGQVVNPGSRLGVVFATDVAEVRLPLTDHDLAFVNLPGSGAAAGSGPMVKLQAVKKGQLAEWDAQIVRSEGVVDELSRVTYAVARIKDPYQLHGDGPALPIGTFVAASIQGSTVNNVLRVPRSAVRGADQVLVVDDDNKLQIRTVGVIRADAEYAYVRDGVVAGERIVLTSVEAPSNGMSVRTTDRPDAATEDEQDALIATEAGLSE